MCTKRIDTADAVYGRLLSVSLVLVLLVAVLTQGCASFGESLPTIEPVAATIKVEGAYTLTPLGVKLDAEACASWLALVDGVPVNMGVCTVELGDTMCAVLTVETLGFRGHGAVEQLGGGKCGDAFGAFRVRPIRPATLPDE